MSCFFISSYLIPLQLNLFEGVFSMHIYPTLEEIKELANDHHFIPISCKVWADSLTPIRLFQQIKGKYSFLLESVEGGEKWAKYSFIGNNPFLLYSVRDGQVYLDHFTEGGQVREKVEGEPLAILKGLLKTFQLPEKLDLPRFAGGAVGYIGYDAITLIESIPPHLESPLSQDQIRLMFCEDIIAFNHLQQEITFITYLHLNEKATAAEIEEEYQQKSTQLKQRIETIFQKLQQDHFQLFSKPSVEVDDLWSKVESNCEKRDFLEAVKQVQTYIHAGETSQTVLSQRFSMDVKTDPFNIYRVLRSINPSPYLYYLDLGDEYTIVGSSPERLVHLEDGKVETNPIAGTRPRGQTEAEDKALAAELLADVKEIREHQMLVDLGKQDLARISKPGTVKVSKEMEIQPFSHVMHMVSTVEGELADGFDAVDCLFACFPAGTVSGAPKVRAMEIIAELEKEARHAYAGAIGYFSFSGNMDTCITIRTIIIHNGKAYVQAGAGIVADSIPEVEWQETRNKAKAMLLAIQLAEQIFSSRDEEESVYV